MIKVCVFDFDGTLVDTMDGFADIAGELLKKTYGISFEEGRRQYLDTSGIPFSQQLEIIQPGGKKNQECAAEFESRKLEGFFRTTPEESTRKGLRLLQEAGYKLVVSSNNSQDNVEKFIEKHPLPMDLVLGFDEKQGLEKGRSHFLKVESAFGVTPDEILFCGDSLKDGERAEACGVHFIGKTGIFTREQFLGRFSEIDTVESIMELAKKLVRASFPL